MIQSLGVGFVVAKHFPKIIMSLHHPRIQFDCSLVMSSDVWKNCLSITSDNKHLVLVQRNPQIVVQIRTFVKQ